MFAMVVPVVIVVVVVVLAEVILAMVLVLVHLVYMWCPRYSSSAHSNFPQLAISLGAGLFLTNCHLPLTNKGT